MTHPASSIQYRISIILLLCIGLPGAVTEPVRIALPFVNYVRGAAPSNELYICLGLYLRERLNECKSVRLVSDDRALAILGELKNGKRTFSRETLLQDFCDFLPIDALIDIRLVDDTFHFDIHRKGGISKNKIPYVKKAIARPAVKKAARLLAEKLELPPEEQAILTEDRIPNSAVFRAVYVPRRISSKWPINSGEARLKVIRPVWGKHRNDALLCAEALRNADYTLAARNRIQEYAKTARDMAKSSLLPVLGTPYESAARGIIKRLPSLFEEDLHALAKPLFALGLEAEVENPIEEEDPEAGLDDADNAGLDISKTPENIPGSVQSLNKVAVAKQLGALRLLGLIQTEKSFKAILLAAKHKDTKTRQVAAVALLHQSNTEVLPHLRRLSKDNDPEVAFTAAISLWKKKQPSNGLLEMAKSFTGKPTTLRKAAIDIVCSLGGREESGLLNQLAEERDASTRRQASLALVAIGIDEPKLYRQFILHPDEAIAIAALNRFPKSPSEELLVQTRKFANDPSVKIAEAARLALAPFRPKTECERRLFDLGIEHTYLRIKLVDQLAALKTPGAMENLLEACANPDPHTRSHALKKLKERAPAAARKQLLLALGDPYRWVRLHAASLIVSLADESCIETLNKQVAVEKDEAIRLYLEDALAKAEGKPMPKARPAARSVKSRKGLVWGFGTGLDSEDSPFDAYYCLRVTPSESWKKAYQKGKIFFGRVENVGNPGTIAVDPKWRDQFWLMLNSDLNEENLPYLDGVVFGEETMSAKPSALWAAGWRLFCIEAGIDPARVKGVQKNLSLPESRAWSRWAYGRIVDGFNILYDYFHLKYGKLKPGLQVATFLPEQGGPNPADKRWKFDVGGLYDYKGCNRIAGYDCVRRYKTIWPERPIIWLSLGIGGYEMNPVKRTQNVPQTIMTTRGARAYADTVSAWVAGADAGWFSTWIFVEKNFRGGMWQLHGVEVGVEDLSPGSPKLERAISYSFRGAEEDYRLAKNKPTLELKIKDAGNQEEENPLETEEEKAAREEIPRKVAEDKERFRTGFAIYQKYVYDCARIFGSLPRQNPVHDTLYVRPGVNVWSRYASVNPLVPGAALLNGYDYLCDINKVPELDLAKYRFITVHNPGLLTDQTIKVLTDWLRNHPGLLYVHRNLSANNSSEASSLEDHDGELQNDWPWEADIAITPAKAPKGRSKLEAVKLQGKNRELEVKQARIGSTFTITGKADTIFSSGEKVLAALWRQPGEFKGAVFFDGVESASSDYLTELKGILNGIHQQHGIGIPLDGPIFHQKLETENLIAAATTGYCRGVSENHSYQGLDLLTGESNPRAGAGRRGVVIAKNMTNKFIAAHNGIAVLSDKPLTKAETIEGGLVIHSDGLLRVSSSGGVVNVSRLNDKPLPEPEDPIAWILKGKDEGLVRLPFGKTEQLLTFVRSNVPVKVTAK